MCDVMLLVGGGHFRHLQTGSSLMLEALIGGRRDSIVKSVERRLPAQKVQNSHLDQMKPLTYTFNTCRYLSWCTGDAGIALRVPSRLFQCLLVCDVGALTSMVQKLSSAG